MNKVNKKKQEKNPDFYCKLHLIIRHLGIILPQPHIVYCKMPTALQRSHSSNSA